ncbi:MAG: enoyl-CoA hydratase-related protein [Microbacterium sp.]
MYETLQVEKAPVTVVTLDRPPVNAVTRQMQRELTEVFESLGDDDGTRAIVLRGAGERAFCAGIDLNEVATERSDPAFELPLGERVNPGLQWRRTQHAIRHAPVPVIAAVEAPAIGAGFGLVGVCDIIIASSNARFGLTEIDVGLLGGASKALRMVGPFKTRMMMFSGELQSAEELHRLGAVERVVTPGTAFDEAVRLAEHFASKSPLAMRLAKESIVRIETDAMEDAYRMEWDYTNRLAGFEDSAEAMSAYLEKRKPEWKRR